MIRGKYCQLVAITVQCRLFVGLRDSTSGNSNRLPSGVNPGGVFVLGGLKYGPV